MKVYVDRATYEVFTEAEREEAIMDRANVFAEDAERFEKFLGKYKRTELLYFGLHMSSIINIQSDFFDECVSEAEREFDSNFVMKTISV